MSHDFQGFSAHSAEWFNDVRDHWWNEDYLRFLAGHWRAEDICTALDVGCGVGHWGRLLSRVLPDTCRMTGVDRETIWVQKATERAQAAGLSHRLTYQVGTAEALPFEDGSFDLVTCQTLLMHLREPARGLAEMVRVTRPGGLVLVTEPTNVLGPVLLDALVIQEPLDSIAPLLRFQLQCQQGKRRLGEGNDLIGDSLPTLFAAAGLEQLELRLNDRVNSILPPYRSSAARALVEWAEDLATRGLWMWNQETTRRYFVAGDGREEEFESHWAATLGFLRRVADAMSAGRYACASSGLCYLAWGRKPAKPEAAHTLGEHALRGVAMIGASAPQAR
jgi:SAM-dependent methyltransferase